ncbi:asparaginase domain-containing protein [Prosthecomicrobium sp. N25]|uniref:asparaginase domain-containing protein n=1 Tax=Prosthecomicrobium sp. N25 TaxID=3129254 RepID=UPI00307810FC
MPKPRIAHMAGPTATIQNTPPLVTSNKARAKAGLPLRAAATGAELRFDALRAQRLAAPARIHVEQFSAHPLEADAADLYGPPDGYVGADGVFSKERRASGDKPVYEVELRPEDGLYPLPYMALQSDGRPWDDECADPGAPDARARQGFFPDGSRSFEEIDRLSVDESGLAGVLSSVADIDFFRVLPPSGFRKGLPQAGRADLGEGDIPPERRGYDFFPYRPYQLASAPPRPALAKVTNDVAALAADPRYDGLIWTQGSPQVEECAYWFNLLIDTTKPIACNSAQRPQGQISNDGPHNIRDSVRYIASRVWDDGEGRNRMGTLVIQEQQFFAAREVAKADARPGGYVATGGHGGILGQISHLGRIAVTYLPAYRHTWRSDVRLTVLPDSVEAVRAGPGGIERFPVRVKEAGRLLPDAIPSVSIIKDGSFAAADFGDDPEIETDLKALIADRLALGRLAGFVVEGLVPYGKFTSAARTALGFRAVFSGLPLVMVGRGYPEGFADPHPLTIAGANLTATKARLLLMACLMKFGSLPPARDPAAPTPEEVTATREAVARYQAVFDTH